MTEHLPQELTQYRAWQNSLTRDIAWPGHWAAGGQLPGGATDAPSDRTPWDMTHTVKETQDAEWLIG